MGATLLEVVENKALQVMMALQESVIFSQIFRVNKSIVVRFGSGPSFFCK